MFFRRMVLVVGIAGLLWPSRDASAQTSNIKPTHAADMERGLTLFKSDVRAILVENCLECHGGDSIKGDFDLSTREKLLESGFVSSNGDGDYLLSLLKHDSEPFMPK